MAYAINVEPVVIGFINTHKDGMEFTLKNIDDYIGTLWNAGMGPIRLNYTQNELIRFLNGCDKICLRRTANGWKIDKSFLSDKIKPEEQKLCRNNKELAKSFDLFCRLRGDFRLPQRILDAMGYRFLYQ